MELSIIFVNWNSADYLTECIDSIYTYTHDLDFEIIVVDNASPNRDVGVVATRFPQVRIIECGENLGFSRANNIGFRQSQGASLLFLNPDTKLVGPAINRLMDGMRSLPHTGIIGGRQVSPDLTVQTTSIQKFPTVLNQIANVEFLRLRWPRFPLWDLGPLFSDDTDPVRVEVIPGACMLIRREVFERVGMFSEEYFMYAEDIDLNYKIAQAGFSNYYIPDAVIIHYGGASSKQQKVSEWATTMKFRAMDQYYVKSRGRWYAALYRSAMGSSAIVRLFLIALMFPAGKLLHKRHALRSTAAKWCAILRWSFGLNHRVLNPGDNR